MQLVKTKNLQKKVSRTCRMLHSGRYSIIGEAMLLCTTTEQLSSDASDRDSLNSALDKMVLAHMQKAIAPIISGAESSHTDFTPSTCTHIYLTSCASHRHYEKWNNSTQSTQVVQAWFENQTAIMEIW